MKDFGLAFRYKLFCVAIIVATYLILRFGDIIKDKRILYIAIPLYIITLIVFIIMIKVKLRYDSNIIHFDILGKQYIFKWEDIKNVRYFLGRVIIVNHQNKKIRISWNWDSHNEIWMDIYGYMTRKHYEDKLHPSFMNKINKLKRKPNKWYI